MLSRVITLLYHDVLDGQDPDTSGFSGPNAAEYKLSVDEFRQHLESIKGALKSPVVTQLSSEETRVPPVMLAFDDGGVSAYEIIAPLLEEYGWRGFFFITTDFINSDAFMTRRQIRDLHDRGHIIGSHSCSHPDKITECTREQLLFEWGESLGTLTGILNKSVDVASIPGGFYSKEVAETAIKCGVKVLFTSEPVQKIQYLNDCAILGRYSVKRGMGKKIPAEYVANNRLRQLGQFSYWNIKKAAKAFTGPVYPWVRDFYLSRK